MCQARSEQAPDYIGCIRIESARFRDTISPERLDLDVVSCPGWSIRDLAHHLGEVQRWARIAAATAAKPDEAAIDDPPTSADDETVALKSWLATGSDALCEVLAAAEPQGLTWHPFPVPQVTAVWPRRQAHEVAIHRWDIQQAAGVHAESFGPLASDFVREYFEVIVPRVVDRDARVAPVGRLGVRLTDVCADLLVASTGDTVTLAALDGAPVDAFLSGTADEVLLALWQRKPLAAAATSPLAREWLAFGGN